MPGGFSNYTGGAIDRPNVQMWTSDGYGNMVDFGGGPISLAGSGPSLFSQAYQGQGYADSLVKQNMANAIDPRTGALLKTPRTPAEYAEVQRQSQMLANAQSKATFAQQMSMLGMGGGNTGPNGTGSFGAPGQVGGTGGVGSAGGNIPAPAIDKGMQDAFTQGILKQIQNPGLGERYTQDMVNRQTDSLGTAESQAVMAGKNSANAAGFGQSGDAAAAEQATMSDYAGQAAGAARDTRLGLEKQNQDTLMQALNQAGGYATHQTDALNSYYAMMRQEQQANRMAAVGLLGQQNQIVPGASGGFQGLGGVSVGTNNMFGGGANYNNFGTANGNPSTPRGNGGMTYGNGPAFDNNSNGGGNPYPSGVAGGGASNYGRTGYQSLSPNGQGPTTLGGAAPDPMASSMASGGLADMPQSRPVASLMPKGMQNNGGMQVTQAGGSMLYAPQMSGMAVKSANRTPANAFRMWS